MFGSTTFLPVVLALSALSSTAGASSSPHHANHQLSHAKRFGKVARNSVVEGRSTDGSGLAIRDGDDKKQLSKRAFSGRATFFAPGLGACGTYSSASDYVSFVLLLGVLGCSGTDRPLKAAAHAHRPCGRPSSWLTLLFCRWWPSTQTSMEIWALYPPGASRPSPSATVGRSPPAEVIAEKLTFGFHFQAASRLRLLFSMPAPRAPTEDSTCPPPSSPTLPARTSESST